MNVWPASLEKSTTTSARWAGPRSNECLSTLPALNTVGSVTQVIGCIPIWVGCASQPDSVASMFHVGPAGLRLVSGVGKTNGSVLAWDTCSWSSATSVQLVPSSRQLSPAALLPMARYSCRLKNRSLAALRILNRIAVGSTVNFGYAVPLIIGVSAKASMPIDSFGTPGISFHSVGSHQSMPGTHVPA